LMLGVDPDIGSSALRLWVAAGSAALLVFVCTLAFNWARTRTAARVSVVVVGAVLGATLAWAFLDGASVRDQGAERRALELRAAELSGQALAPGSPLSCLDGLAGENVETACEKALFAAPATVAAATSYIAARLVLLADTIAYAQHGGTHIDGVVLPLRRSLETDRFGFVAHALVVRDGCTSENCKALSLLHDPSRVRANLSGQTLDRYLDRYVAAWAQNSDVPVADAASAQSSTPQGQRKVMLDINFPTAASIPAVSIMNPEPKGPPTQAAAAAAVIAGADSSAQAASSAPAAASKQARKQAKNPPVQAAAAPPPPPAGPVEPVWSPGGTLASPQPAAPAGAPAGAGPVQLNPFTAPPEANASAPAHAQ
jgi:hypothetical protein